jgi:hypothetical protein
MCLSYNPNSDDNMIHGVLDNSFDLQEGDQVFFLAPGEQIEIVAVNNEEDDDDSDDSDYEETDTDDDEEEDDEEDENDEEEEKHQFYRQQAAEWQEHQELEEAKAEQLFEDEWRYREQFQDELRSGQLTQEEIVVSDTESDTEELVETQQRIHLGPPPVLRRERASDYLSPNTRPDVSTPEAPRANRRVLRDITNIVPRRIHFN